MSHLAPIARLLPLLLAGCWPYLPGPYSDYADTDAGPTDTDEPQTTLALAGDFVFTQRRGSYWFETSRDGDSNGGYALMYLSDDVPGTAIGRWSGGTGRCRDTSENTVAEDHALPVEGGAPFTLRGSQSYRLEYFPDNNLWYGEFAEGSPIPLRDTLELPSVQTPQGTLAHDALVSFPRQLTITEPDMTRVDPPVLSRSEFRVAWQGQADGTLLRVVTVAPDGNADEDRICGMGPETQSFTVSVEDLPSMSTAAYAVVQVGSVSEGTGEVGSGVDNATSAIFWQTGAVLFQ